MNAQISVNPGLKRDMKKNTCMAAKEWFEKKFVIINGFECLFEITIFKYKIELQNILLVLMSFQKAALKSQHRPYNEEL